MTQRPHETPTPDRTPRHQPSEAMGLGLPVVALAALTGAVLYFGLSPAAPRPPAAPRTGHVGDAGAARPEPVSEGAAGTVAGAPVGPPTAAIDPLPSWNEGATKRAILDFVKQVTSEGSETFVPVPERVAVFDHDGTLVCEKPIVHGMFFVDRVKALVEKQPDLGHDEPYATLLTGDIDMVRRLGKKYLLDLIFTTLAGATEEQLEADTRQFLATARHPVFDVPYAEVTYQPMKELIALLRSRDFSVWICSGSGVHFMRPAAEDWYGIGPEHVIASRAVSELREVGAAGDNAASRAPNQGLQLVVTPRLQVINDEERKPVSIGEHIGRRPIFAAGNVGSTGDIEMLQWSQSSRRPTLQLLVLHDDAEREMAYGEPSNDSLEAAERYGWNVVRMATDWNRIFVRPLEKKAAVQSQPTAVPAVAEEPVPAAAATQSRWEKDVAGFEKADREQPPVPGGVVFLGSSNIRMWTTMAEDFAGMHPINRGVGGARLTELAALATRLTAAAKPAVVVVSAGTNDIASGATAVEIRDAFAALTANLRRELPELKIVFLAIAPSIERWGQRDRQREANEMIREFIASQPQEAAGGGVAYLDANAAFLDADGLPAAECFLDDRQHPSTIGNARRAGIIRPFLAEMLP